jgi:hypothetical protein
MDHSQLADKYSAMTAEEFERLNRTDLAEWAKPHYDGEKARRVPGWRHEEPTSEERLLEFTLLQKCMKRQLVINVGLWSAVLLGGYVFTLTAIPSYTDLQIYLIIMLFLAGTVVFPQQSAFARNTGYLVLWLRRFHRRQQKPFQNILERACTFVGTSITIQDSSFRSSQAMASTRISTFGWFLFVILLVFGYPVMNTIYVLIAVIIAFTWFVIVFALFRRLGHIKLRESNSRDRTFRLIQTIRERKAYRGGVVILKCEDSFWHDVVSLAIQHADAVIVDVTEPSENVIWELQTALRAKAPENILLAYEKDEKPFDLPPAISAELQAAVGSVPLNRLATFVYPRKRSRVPWKNSLQSFLISDLREILTKCISHSIRQPLASLHHPQVQERSISR